MKERNKIKTIAQIKQLIANDELEKSIILIKEIVKLNKHINYLILQSARFNELKKAVNLNIVDWTNARLEKSKIRISLLDLLDELNADLYQEQVFSEQNHIPVESVNVDILKLKSTSLMVGFQYLGNEALKDVDWEELNALSITNTRKREDYDNIGLEILATRLDRNFLPGKVSYELDETDKKIIQFLTEFKGWYFSAARIVRWGSNQIGYDEFSNLNIINVEERLSKLYYRSLLVRVSPKEKYKLYKIKENNS